MYTVMLPGLALAFRIPEDVPEPLRTISKVNTSGGSRPEVPVTGSSGKGASPSLGTVSPSVSAGVFSGVCSGCWMSLSEGAFSKSELFLSEFSSPKVSSHVRESSSLSHRGGASSGVSNRFPSSYPDRSSKLPKSSKAYTGIAELASITAAMRSESILDSFFILRFPSLR